MTDIFFHVDGLPAGQGSKTAYVRGGRAVLVEANKRLPEWRSAVKTAAELAVHATEELVRYEEPVKLSVTFFLPKPAKPRHAEYPGSKPDLDKLIRAIGDALTQSQIIKDDSLIVEIWARKLWTGTSTDTYPTPGCRVHLSQK